MLENRRPDSVGRTDELIGKHLELLATSDHSVLALRRVEEEAVDRMIGCCEKKAPSPVSTGKVTEVEAVQPENRTRMATTTWKDP